MSVTKVQLVSNVSTGASFAGIVTASSVIVGTGITLSSSGINVSGIITATSIVVSAGTTAAPSISPTGDSNTGIFFPSADQLAVATNGTGRLFVDSSGNVGVNTSSPGSFGRFVSLATTSSAVYATADNGYALFDGATNSSEARINIAAGTAAVGVHIWGYNSTRTGYTPLNYAGSYHVFKTDTTERLRIDSSGRLLVGTSTATANGGVLELSGGITFPATAVAATNANTLDDYEEGSITGMTVTGGTSGTMATSSLVGKYVKIGDLVTVNIYLRQSTTTAVGSYFDINGALPFMPSTNPFYLYTAAFSDYNSATSIVAQVLGGATAIRVFTNPALISNGQEMAASATYKISNP